MVKYASYHICIICVFMNINKNAKNNRKSLKYKYADFIPILSLLHVLISSMLQFDKSIHPVVLLVGQICEKIVHFMIKA